MLSSSLPHAWYCSEPYIRANARIEPGRSERSKSAIGVSANEPGSVSAKTPALQIVQVDESAGQRVEQEMAGAEVGRGGPDTPAGDEFERGPGGWPRPAVKVQPHR